MTEINVLIDSGHLNPLLRVLVLCQVSENIQLMSTVTVADGTYSGVIRVNSNRIIG